jgi:hypothetical protein
LGSASQVGGIAPSVVTTSPLGILRPTPDQAATQAATFLLIDPRMTDADRYLDRSVNQCQEIRENGRTGALANTRRRFEGGTLPDMTDEQVQRIIDAIRVWCSTK